MEQQSQSIQSILNATQRNREKYWNDFATPSMKRKANTDPEVTTHFRKPTPKRDWCIKDDLDDAIIVLSTDEDEDFPNTLVEALQSDETKCQFPNCRSTCQGIPSKCFAHMVTHLANGSRRFQCSECDFAFNSLYKFSRHLKRNCGGKSIDKLDQRMIDEWRQLSAICYPKRVKEIDGLIAKKEATLFASMPQIDRDTKKEVKIEKTMKNKAPINSSSDVQMVPKSRIAPEREEYEGLEAFFSPDVHRLNHSTTSGNVLIQSNVSPNVSPLSMLLMNSKIKEEGSPRTQSIQQQDSDLPLQQLTQEVVRLRAENQMLNTRAADEKNWKDMVLKLLGEKNIEIEMQKEKIHQLQAELEKYVVTSN